MTAIVGMALGTRPVPQENLVDTATANFALPSGETQPNKRLLDSQNKEVKASSAGIVKHAQVKHHLDFFLLQADVNFERSHRCRHF